MEIGRAVSRERANGLFYAVMLLAVAVKAVGKLSGCQAGSRARSAGLSGLAEAALAPEVREQYRGAILRC